MRSGRNLPKSCHVSGQIFHGRWDVPPGAGGLGRTAASSTPYRPVEHPPSPRCLQPLRRALAEGLPGCCRYSSQITYHYLSTALKSSNSQGLIITAPGA